MAYYCIKNPRNECDACGACRAFYVEDEDEDEPNCENCVNFIEDGCFYGEDETPEHCGVYRRKGDE